MTSASEITYTYQVGGSLPANAPTYVKRRADDNLYAGLQSGEFCYVLNSRQMGKSSLRVRTMQRLEAEGVACVAIDLTRIGSQQVSAEQWYAGLVRSLWSGLHLTEVVNLRQWWRDRELLSPVQRLGEFVDEVMLEHVAQKIVVFIDEIDSVISLSFPTDDFFAWIRACYNLRADATKYDRLTFALLGVATPSDLIRDDSRTPFNVGRAVPMTGFQPQEAVGLARGFATLHPQPQEVLQAILDWTSGQPFLTQKLCRLAIQELESSPLVPKSKGQDSVDWVGELVKQQVVENWEAQDEPEHLKTIRDRLLRNEQRARRLLGIYQTILEQGKIAADDSSAQMELCLSGLVVRREGYLQVANRIYQAVFNPNWVANELANLRPYSELLQAWLASNCRDESRLLRGQSLQDALAWAASKSLSDRDYQFLTASQELDKREAQLALEAERRALEAQRQANQILTVAAEKAKRRIRIGSFVLAVSVVGAAIGATLAWRASVSLRAARAGTQIEQTGGRALRQFEFEQIKALMAAIQAGEQLRSLVGDRVSLQDYPTVSPLFALQKILDNIQERNQLSHPDTVTSVSFSPDGKRIATAATDGVVRLWDLHGSRVAELRGHMEPVYSLRFHPDGESLASASADKTVRLWNLRDKKSVRFTGHQDEVYDVAFASDGAFLATVDKQGILKLWNLQGKAIAQIKAHQEPINSVAIAPDDKLLATASKDGTVKVWNRDGKLVAELVGHENGIQDVAFSPDGNLLATASEDDTARLWDVQGRLLRVFRGHQGAVYSTAFSSDGQRLATASADDTARIWDLQGKLIAQLRGHQGPLYSLGFSQDGHFLVTGSQDNTARLWDLKTNLLLEPSGLQAGVASVGFDAEGAIAFGLQDGTIRLKGANGSLEAVFQAHQDKIYSISFHPSGERFVTASEDGTAKLWSRQGNLIRTIATGNDAIYNVAFDSDGTAIATADKKGKVQLWNEQGAPIRTLQAGQEPMYSVAFSRDRELVVAGARDGTVVIWNASNGDKLKSFKAHQRPINRLVFSPDGQQLVTASRESEAYLWDLQGNRLEEFTGHPGPVYTLNFDRQGQRLATASRDGTTNLWDLQGNLLAEFKGGDRPVFGVAFSQDGTQLVTVSDAGDVRQWQAEGLEQLLDRACNWLEDYLATHPDRAQDLACPGLKETEREGET